MVTMLNHAGRRTEGARYGGHVNIVIARILWDRRQHTDNGVYLVIHPEVPADDVGIAAVALFPVIIAEDQNGIGARFVVRIAEEASQVRLYAEKIEEVR